MYSSRFCSLIRNKYCKKHIPMTMSIIYLLFLNALGQIGSLVSWPAEKIFYQSPVCIVECALEYIFLIQKQKQKQKNNKRN